MVPKEGLEPSLSCEKWILNPSRLPIPPLRQESYRILWHMPVLGEKGISSGAMKRIHRRLFALNDKIASIDRELDQTKAELEYHRSIDDDAQRDAALGNYIDREEAGLTRGDVRRFEKTISSLNGKREALQAKLEKLLEQLPD